MHMHGQGQAWTSCICSTYPSPMVSRAKDTHTTNRVVRIDDEDWAAYELACKAKGLSRAADIRMHIKRELAAWRRQHPDEAAAFAIALRGGKEVADTPES